MNKEQLSRWKYQRFMEDYLRCVKSVDDNIGRVLEYLDEQGLAKNTIVIYTSDQGFFMGEHGLFDKRFMYEEAMRTPLIMRYPKQVKPLQTAEELVMNIDIAPTLIDFAGVAIPADIQGESMKSLVCGQKNYEWRKDIYYHYYQSVFGVSKHYGLHTGRYKLIHFYDPLDTWELYDLGRDPLEMDNLADNPAYAGVLKKMRKRLEAKQAEVKDTVFQ